MDTTLHDPLVGRVVDGRYLVESRIARGGMATVYLALDHRLDRQVALKVMHEHLATDPEFVSRFVREARSAARLSHPNVVAVFDQGSDQDVLYLAMEYLPGRTLRDVLSERGALTPRESVSVLEPVLGALAAAHRAGIVHRDVKPENVLLADDGRIKVADFGLARAISSTTGGDLLGTVAYLAPELVSRGVADARADVYAAGIVLFELLTGKQPFTGSDPMQVAYRHVHESVPTPTSLSPELPVAFDQVVLEATSHDPDLRPPDAGRLLADLHAAQAQVPDGQLDVRSADAVTLRLAASRTSGSDPAAPAAATQPQPTRTLETSRRGSRRERPGDLGGRGGPMVPRLRVHDDEPLPPGFLGDRRRQALAALAGAAVLVLVICSGVWWFTGGPGSYTGTPTLAGQRASDAERILASRGLKWHERPAYSTTVAAQQVISTDPAAGRKVKKSGTVILTVSKGPELHPVPAVGGQPLQPAQDSIRAAKLTVGPVKRQYSSTVAEGQVIATSPKQGTMVAPDRPVSIIVSRGVQLVPLDAVTGWQVADAVRVLKSHGFTPEQQPQPFAMGQPAPGTVTAQNPGVQTPGQTAPKGSVVTLTVVQQPEQKEVPSVLGWNIDQARSTLQGLGFQVQQQGGGFFRNTVTGQSAQGPQPVGTVIVLNVG